MLDGQPNSAIECFGTDHTLHTGTTEYAIVVGGGVYNKILLLPLLLTRRRRRMSSVVG